MLHMSENCEMTNVKIASSGVSVVPKVQQWVPWFGKVMAWSHPHKTNIYIYIILQIICSGS
jgi:hypothetical protein